MRIAILAGEGTLPVEIARTLTARGETPVAIAFCSDPEKMRALCDPVIKMRAPRLSYALKEMKRLNVDRVIMAGAVSKKIIFLPALFDPLLLKLLMRSRRDDHSLLGAVVACFESEGIKVLPYAPYIPQCLAEEGTFGHRAPNEAELRDIAYGSGILKALLPFSFGQGLVVADEAIVAVEAMEGTDAMIARAGGLVKKGALIKMMRVDQDERYDLPTIGPRTITGMAEAGLTCLAVEAERTLILEQPEVLKRARASDIALYGLPRQKNAEMGADINA